MKKLLIIFICLVISNILIAQETARQKEIGLVFNNFDSFGLTFKFGSEKALWRFNTLLFNGQQLESTNDLGDTVEERCDLNFGVNLGKEYRTEINPKIELRMGADLSFKYNKLNIEYFNDLNRIFEIINYNAGINFVLGFNYVIRDNFLVGAEILPFFSYTIRKSDHHQLKAATKGFVYGLSSESVLLSLSYRFK